MIFGLVCCLVGAVLLSGAGSRSDEWILVGAAVASLGVMAIWISLKNWLRWKQYKKNQNVPDGKLVSDLKWLEKPGPQQLTPMSEPDPRNRRRSHRVMLQVTVLIKAEMSAGNRVQIQAFTIVVNAHGGLLESPFRMAVGQKITLVNPQSGKEVGCRIVLVERAFEGHFTTAFEFDERSPRFWPISLPPPDWQLTPESAENES